jgi:hypothetical protein
MDLIKVDRTVFNFKYLPEYAEYILKNHLEEFVTISIRFSRELNLPLLKPLAKMPEKELVKLSIESNTRMLTAIKDGKIAEHIEENLNKWIENKLLIVDKFQIEAEDLTLGYHIRRKLFSYFLYGYTKSAPIQQSIFNEVDVYTSMEELVSLKAYMDIQRLKDIKKP